MNVVRTEEGMIATQGVGTENEENTISTEATVGENKEHVIDTKTSIVENVRSVIYKHDVIFDNEGRVICELDGNVINKQPTICENENKTVDAYSVICENKETKMTASKITSITEFDNDGDPIVQTDSCISSMIRKLRADTTHPHSAAIQSRMYVTLTQNMYHTFGFGHIDRCSCLTSSQL
ncbi:hypothetical protein DPMN_135509 [Dreissena polymorpha]|uniref:Uncharacterized protein n=1 Tax=Dreissena polymorpha TaxID=45954 RepID=A0A9D4FZ75_DREPO|nr:hypothetical protein DPMN_135509 [Dreissena polymorpha]